MTDQDVGARALLVLVVGVAAEIDERAVENVRVDVLVSVDRFGGEIVVVKVRVGIAVDVGREEDARERVGDAQARVLGLFGLHLKSLELARQLAACLATVVLNK